MATSMRAIWKGSISLGLVGIGVKLYSATEEKDIKFNQVHAADGGRIEMHRICAADDEEVPYAEIVKGFDLGHGNMVILTDEDLADVPVPTARAITVLEFVPTEQVDPTLYAKAYYLAPDGDAAVKPYLLLLRSLERAGRVGIVKIAIRQRERLAAMRVRDDVILLNMMLWPDEVREPTFSFLDKSVTLRPQEKKMADSLVESMAGEFHPEEFTDDYRAAVQELVQAKLEGHEVAHVKAEKPTKDADLLEVLTASVERLRESRGRAAAPATGGRAAVKTAAKKAATAKAVPKKAVAKKATAAKKTAPAKKATSRKAA